MYIILSAPFSKRSTKHQWCKYLATVQSHRLFTF